MIFNVRQRTDIFSHIRKHMTSRIPRPIESSFLALIRYPYEEPYHLQLDFAASNGVFSGGFDFYCATESLVAFATELIHFPATLESEVVWEVGSPKLAERHYRYLHLRAHVFDHRGHCGLQMRMSSNNEPPDDASCDFTVTAEAAAINRLGEALLRFSRFEDSQLMWTPHETTFA
jgi:hypothetical protein